MSFDFDCAIARVPKWMLAVAVIGVAVAVRIGGVAYAGPFLVGAAASYLNFRLIEKAVNKLGEAAKANPPKPPKRAGIRMFIQFMVFVLGAFVILRVSGFSLLAAFTGFLVCPAAAILELVFELFTYGHS